MSTVYGNMEQDFEITGIRSLSKGKYIVECVKMANEKFYS